MSKGRGTIVIVKKAKGHAYHGGAWKVAYADFVTAMMALFIVLWLLSQTNDEMKEDIAEYFRTGVFSGAPSLLGSGNGLLDAADLDVRGNSLGTEDQLLQQGAESVRQAVSKLELGGVEDRVEVSLVDEGLLIQIIDGGDSLIFDVASSELKPALVSLLEAIGPILARIPNRLQLRGHTDARPYPAGSKRDNWQLSFERADNARHVLERSGLRPGQVAGVFAHADSMPLDKDPLSPRNRRLAILAVRRSPPPAAPPKSAASKSGMARPRAVAAQGK